MHIDRCRRVHTYVVFFFVKKDFPIPKIVCEQKYKPHGEAFQDKHFFNTSCYQKSY